MGHCWYMLTKTKITVVQNGFNVKAQSSLQLNLFFTLVKFKTTGHVGEVYKGLLRKGEGFLILSRGWVVHAKVTSIVKLEFVHMYFQSHKHFGFLKFETNIILSHKPIPIHHRFRVGRSKLTSELSFNKVKHCQMARKMHLSRGWQHRHDELCLAHTRANCYSLTSRGVHIFP